MKEVTYEDWQKNPTPRMMWVWNYNEEDKKKLKVAYLLHSKDPYPIVTVTADEGACDIYMHCAEIEKQKRMTNKELSRWLREKPTREYKFKNSDFVYGEKNYREIEQDEEVVDNTLIREDDGEWREPLVEVEE